MTTSEPRTPHDDTPREHRRLGQRILDAVLGDPADTRPDDPADPRRAPTRTAPNADRAGAEGFAGDGPRGELLLVRAGHADRRASADDRPGHRPDAQPTRGTPLRDAGHHAGGAVSDAIGTRARPATSTGTTPSATPGTTHARTPARPATPTGTTPPRSGDPHATPAHGRPGGHRPRPRPGYDQPGSRAETAPGAAHDLPRPGAGTAGDDRDLVTSSYDPDRDTGYDPQAAGTAMAAPPGRVPRARPTATPRPDYDAAGDTGYLDDPRRGGARDYDPAQDTGYVDASRAEADRTTGRRDDDFDTGRVDTGRADLGRADLDLNRDAGDRVPTERVDRDRDDTHRGAGAAAGAAGAGAVAAAAFRGDRSDTDRDLDRDHDRDARFSAVDDTATVDGTDTGRSTAETAAAGDGRARAGVADEDGESGTRERLVPAERAQDYSSRWDALKGDFVDEPRRAVRQADELVGELLDEIQRLFADQRRNLEQGFDHDRASTEDLRLALRRYRSFFDRLLSF